MKAVAAHPKLAVVAIGQWIEIVLRRHALVKRGIKHRHRLGVWQCVQKGANTDCIDWIVQRGQPAEIVNLGQHGRVDAYRVTKRLAAVGHPVPDAANLIEPMDDVMIQ